MTSSEALQQLNAFKESIIKTPHAVENIAAMLVLAGSELQIPYTSKGDVAPLLAHIDGFTILMEATSLFLPYSKLSSPASVFRFMTGILEELNIDTQLAQQAFTAGILATPDEFKKLQENRHDMDKLRGVALGLKDYSNKSDLTHNLQASIPQFLPPKPQSAN